MYCLFVTPTLNLNFRCLCYQQMAVFINPKCPGLSNHYSTELGPAVFHHVNIAKIQSGFDCVYCVYLFWVLLHIWKHSSHYWIFLETHHVYKPAISPLSGDKYFRTGRCIRQQVGSPSPLADEFIFVSVSSHFWYIPRGITWHHSEGGRRDQLCKLPHLESFCVSLVNHRELLISIPDSICQ